jgi:prophage maintenance system killer protein
LAAAEFLELCGWLIEPREEEIEPLIVRVAEGQADEEEVAAWFQRYRIQKPNI